MTLLAQHNNNTAQHLEALNNQITAIQEQLNSLTHEVRVTNQRHKAQESLAKEWQAQLKTMGKLLRDACSIYGDPEVLGDMLEDVSKLVEQTKINFDEHVTSDRYLNQQTSEEEDETINEPIEQPLQLTGKSPATKKDITDWWKAQSLMVRANVQQELNIPEESINSISKVRDFIHSLKLTEDDLYHLSDKYQANMLKAS